MGQRVIDIQDWGWRIGEARHHFRRCKRIGYAVTACLVLSGCDANFASGPSEETAYLDREVIPQLIDWWAGPGEDFSFAHIAASRGYDTVCIIGQYGSLQRISKEADPINSYRSTFGNAVPENYFALVVIRKGIAHATTSRLRRVPVGAIPGQLCFEASKAVLKRISRSPDPQPYALLGVAS